MPYTVTDIGELTPALDAETGFQLEDPRLQELLVEATKTFNAYAAMQVSLDGSTYDRELSPKEQRLIVLFALSVWLHGEEVKAAMTAIVHTNVAGRTDLKDIPKNLRALREGTTAELQAILGEIGSGGMSGITSGIQAHELGATLNVSGGGGVHHRQTY